MSKGSTDSTRDASSAAGTSFRSRVLAVVSGIPRGEVMTYAEVASRAGNSRAARAVGSIMRVNRDPTVPCHRVVAAGGRLGGFNRGVAEKARRLQLESAVF